MEQPKLYYFTQNAHHFLISRIDENYYGIFDLCTIRYTGERWSTLEKAIEGAKKYYKNLYILDTYTELAKHILESEKNYSITDLYGDKNLIERQSLHKQKSKEIFFKINNKKG